MNTSLQKEHVIDVMHWPVLALAAPIIGVLAGVVVANIAYRLWTAGLVGAPVVVVLTILPMLLVALVIWNSPKGQLRIDDGELVLDRVLFFDRSANYSQAELTLVRWYPDRTLTPRGVQLWVNDGDNLLKIGVASQLLMDEFDEKSPGLIGSSTTRMPQAELSVDDFRYLLQLLTSRGLSFTDRQTTRVGAGWISEGATRGAD
ncbi:MAG: hypothetical protein KTR32_10865 [Granulosicoccus sp.]|nr:hypothetical protein [Granulosicoccus sp.]